MKIDKTLLEYLEGQKFSNGIGFHYPSKIYPEKRIDFLAELVKGKKVVHLGCLDHPPMIAQKIKNKEWLHGLLTENAVKCIGFDIEEETTREVAEKFGFDNIICEDITEVVNETIASDKWDYLILGELLEHIDNPVDFLYKLRKNYAGSIDKIVITVPNILNVNRMKEMKKCVEVINTDHRFWFTPYTIAKVASESGLKPDEVLFKTRGPLTFMELVHRKIYKIVMRKEPMFPFYYFNRLVLIAEME